MAEFNKSRDYQQFAGNREDKVGRGKAVFVAGWRPDGIDTGRTSCQVSRADNIVGKSQHTDPEPLEAVSDVSQNWVEPKRRHRR
jgi:hypothetical protein